MLFPVSFLLLCRRHTVSATSPLQLEEEALTPDVESPSPVAIALSAPPSHLTTRQRSGTTPAAKLAHPPRPPRPRVPITNSSFHSDASSRIPSPSSVARSSLSFCISSSVANSSSSSSSADISASVTPSVEPAAGAGDSVVDHRAAADDSALSPEPPFAGASLSSSAAAGGAASLPGSNAVSNSSSSMKPFISLSLLQPSSPSALVKSRPSSPSLDHKSLEGIADGIATPPMMNLTNQDAESSDDEAEGQQHQPAVRPLSYKSAASGQSSNIASDSTPFHSPRVTFSTSLDFFDHLSPHSRAFSSSAATASASSSATDFSSSAAFSTPALESSTSWHEFHPDFSFTTTGSGSPASPAGTSVLNASWVSDETPVDTEFSIPHQRRTQSFGTPPPHLKLVNKRSLSLLRPVHFRPPIDLDDSKDSVSSSVQSSSSVSSVQSSSSPDSSSAISASSVAIPSPRPSS